MLKRADDFVKEEEVGKEMLVDFPSSPSKIFSSATTKIMTTDEAHDEYSKLFLAFLKVILLRLSFFIFSCLFLFFFTAFFNFFWNCAFVSRVTSITIVGHRK